MFALMAKFVPVRTMPADPVVLTTPPKVVVPVPALCKMDEAAMEDAIKLPVFVMVKTLIGVVFPIESAKVVSPLVPAFNVKLLFPLIAPPKEILAPAGDPPLFVVSKEEEAFSVVAPPTEIACPAAITLFATARAPVILTPPRPVRAPLELRFTVPLFVKETAPVEVKLLLILYVVPTKVTEPTDAVLLNVVVPVAALV
jgi:hypothetical protein